MNAMFRALRAAMEAWSAPSSTAQLALDRRRAATYPPGKPSDWFHVLWSDELRPGQVKAVEVLGLDLALFRTDAGVVHAVHARCPHMGASLAGGRVDGDDLVCPFHGWRFDGSGRLKAIPGSKQLPGARTPCVPVCECYGMVFIWSGPAGAGGQPPYRPDDWPELDGDDFVHRGRHRPRDIRMHLLEFAENSVDIKHFEHLHTAMRVPWTQIELPGVTVNHVAGWYLDKTRPHVACFTDEAYVILMGRHLPKSGASAHASLVGPASLVMFRITVPKLGSVIIAQTHTPLDGPDAPLRLAVRFTWWVERSMPRALAWYIVGNWVAQWWADVEIWENKVHAPRPVLVDTDGPVHALRGWFRNFYPANPS